jgi:predicted membrane-bound spermidine synthase
LLAVALIAAGTLSYEILLVRIFAIEYFHHFAYMAIGVAMLGFGASGTLLALFGKPDRGAAEAGFRWSVVLTAVSLIVSPTLVHWVSLDPTQLAWNGGQWLRLALVYCLLALPFAVAAMGILLALVMSADRPGTTYGASFVGSGIGAVIALVVLWLVSPARALAVPALCAAIGGFVVAHDKAARMAAWPMFALACFVCFQPLWDLEVSPYKALPQVEAHPNAERVGESLSPIGWVVEVDAPTFRYAPGLSLAYKGSFPNQNALFVDGQIAGASPAGGDDVASAEVLDWLPTALPYAVGDRQQVLVLGAGGGTEVLNAVVHGASRIVAVELHPELANRGREVHRRLREANGDVEWIVGDARSYVAGARESFDLISIPPAGAFGSSAAGVLSLSADFLHTVDAYEAFMRRLTDGGMLAITRWLTIPPRENVRVVLTMVEALRRIAPSHVPDGLVVARSWGTVTVIAKPSGFVATELDALESWANSRQFDIDWQPEMSAPQTVYNHLEEPTLFMAAETAVFRPDSLAQFVATYPFTVAPVSDARPFPHHFLRVQSLGGLFGEDQGSLLPFAEWGLIALLATLVQSTLLAILLLVIPVVIAARRNHERASQSHLAYFFAIGFAYMAAEIAVIQQLSLLLGHPVYAVVVVLSAFLVCSGIGSAWSDRVPISRTWLVNSSLLGFLIVFAVALLSFVHLLQPTPMIVRVFLAAVLICPVAFVMGMPFPHGLRLLAGDSHIQVAWAWAANGFASVVAAPLAALIVLERGSPELFLFAAIAYGVAGVLAKPQNAEKSGSFT